MTFYQDIIVFFKSIILRQATAFLLVAALFCFDFIDVWHANAPSQSFSGLQLVTGDTVAMGEQVYQPNLSKPALAFALMLVAGFFIAVWQPPYYHGYVFLVGIAALACLCFMLYRITGVAVHLGLFVDTRPAFLLMIALLAMITSHSYLRGIKEPKTTQKEKPHIHINIITSKRKS